jgi:hypothetical protein
MGGGIVKRSWAGEVKNVSLLLATSIKDNHYHRLEPLIAITRTVTKNKLVDLRWRHLHFSVSCAPLVPSGGATSLGSTMGWCTKACAITGRTGTFLSSITSG